MKKKILVGIIVAAACLLLIGGLGSIYPLKVLKIKSVGVGLKPTKIIEPIEVAYFLQNDPLWAAESLGNSNSSLGSSGCLVSSIATAVNNYGFSYTPKELNELFTENDVYTENGLVIWKNIKLAIPELGYEYSRIFDVKTIEKLIDSGKLPIIEVKYKGVGINHWVAVIGSDGTDFLVMDPLNQSKTPTKLSEHGSRAYAYRVIVNAP